MSYAVSQRLDTLMNNARRLGRLLVPTSAADATALRRRVRNNGYVRPFPQMYAEKTWWDSLRPDERYWHVVRTYAALHPLCVFAGITALFIRGIMPYQVAQGRMEIEVVTPSSSHSASSRFVRRIPLKSNTRGLASVEHGLRVITIEKSLVDLAHTRNFTEVIGYIFDCIKQGKTSLERVCEAMKELKWFKGLSRLRFALRHLCLSTDNAGEAKVFALISKMGYQRPQTQREFTNPANMLMPYRVDFCWETSAGFSVLELDGLTAKRQKQAESYGAARRALQQNFVRESELGRQNVTRIKHLTYDEAMDSRILVHTLHVLGVSQQ